MYSKSDLWRAVPLSNEQEYRTPFRRDYDRVLHSSAFRRLQGKTQVFPLDQDDFFRTRLTHTLEVCQIATSIVERLNNIDDFFSQPSYNIDSDVVAAACLAHDIGHPPFGHNGEVALNQRMRRSGGFEGNAQSLRIVGRLIKRDDSRLCEDPDIDLKQFDIKGHEDNRHGLNLSARVIASLVKYPWLINYDNPNHKEIEKGIYPTEKALIDKIWEKVCACGAGHAGQKTIECQIMDLADDIAYSTFDLEDAFMGGFMNPLSMICEDAAFYEHVAKKVTESLKKGSKDAVILTGHDVIDRVSSIFDPLWEVDIDLESSSDEKAALIKKVTQLAYRSSRAIASSGRQRTILTSNLVKRGIQNVQVSFIDKDCPAFSRIELEPDWRVTIECLKHLVFETVIMSPRIQQSRYSGRQVISEIFDILTQPNGYLYMPEDFQEDYKKASAVSRNLGKRVIADFIAGMTDRFAWLFYQRLRDQSVGSHFYGRT